MKLLLSHEVLANGNSPEEVLRDFANGQREVLRLWTDDVTAQVQEQLAQKFPGQNLIRVVETINHRFTEACPHRQGTTASQKQSHTGELKI